MSLERGAQAERLARRHLESAGLTLVAANYRCRQGEIDLIMREGDTLVFTEVRHRSHTRFGGAIATIDSHKQRRLRLTAEHYLQRLEGQPPPCRFDVVAVDGSGTIDWITNAF